MQNNKTNDEHVQYTVQKIFFLLVCVLSATDTGRVVYLCLLSLFVYSLFRRCKQAELYLCLSNVIVL